MTLPPQIRDPLKLCPCVFALWETHRNALWEEHKIHTSTIETLRDIARQRYYVEKKVSRTLKSFHLPQPKKQLALAYDIVPASLLTEPGWGEHSPLWDVVGAVGESVGMEWGFALWGWDRPHFQLSSGCRCSELP